jgi:uncharacterized repeat protein (TIGR03803 family)
LLGKRRRALPLLIAVIASFLVTVPARSSETPTVLYTFTAPVLTNAPPVTNSDGIAPASRMVLASDGNLYGTTLHGGANGAGSIFRMTLTGSFSNIYSFPAATNSSGEVVYDLAPNDLTQGTNGNFYGTTGRGGSNFTGTIFEISPSGSFATLHTFAAEITNSSGRVTSADGATPTGALAQGNDGNFYGTTRYGGANGTGTIFQTTPGGAFTSLYSFPKTVAGAPTTNATVPNALVLGANGAFYGTTQEGGVDDAGTFFTFTTTGGFVQIYSFDGQSASNNPITPNSALVQGANGYFYGTSAYGGSQGGGAIFQITNIGTGVVTLLHSFPQLDAGVGAALTLGADGNVYGTTAANGLNGEGTLFRMTPAGGVGVFSFGALDTNSDNAGGANPSAALTADSVGNLYGTCAAGGTNGSGVLFQISDTNFIPPFFLSVSNPPPATINLLAGASLTLSNDVQGLAPLACQWLRNGTNLTDNGDILGSQTTTLIINPVSAPAVGSYALVISDVWGALTSSVTVLTVSPPGVSISTPAPNASISAPAFAGTATIAPFTNNFGPIQLTNVIFSISNTFTSSSITGLVNVTAGAGGASNWSFTAMPYSGTNVLTVQSVDVTGNISPAATRSFFYEMSAPLTVLTTGSGTGSFTITDGEELNLGKTYSITANPISSAFLTWDYNGFLSYDPTLSFVMESNLVLTADFMSRQPPAVFISFPTSDARTGVSVFDGTAESSPVLRGVNSNNVRLTNVVYWLTNAASGTVVTGVATLTPGATVSNWSITVAPSPGTNTLSVQAEDVSGGLSPIVSRGFFYELPAGFTLIKAGTGNGTLTGRALVAGDTPPTNGAMLNVGETYTIVAKADPSSTFTGWAASTGANSLGPSLLFIMQPALSLTATFTAIPPVVTISSPTENLRTASPVFEGTASGHFPIANVFCSLANTNGSATLSRGIGTVSNWSIALVPAPGTNTLTVYCVDANGDASTPISRRFFYKVPSRLSVVIDGNGKFKGAASVAGDAVPANGAMLNLGEGYTITAVPSQSSLFSNWVSAAGNSAPVASATPALSFLMQSNLVLTATFVANFFPAASGTYNGLFFPADGVSEETSGMVYNLVLRQTGAFSGQLLTTGTNYHFSTNFDATGNAAFNTGPLAVTLTLDSATAEITGSISGLQFSANLAAQLASKVPPTADYTMLFSPSTNVSADSPPGDGYALVTNHEGVVTLGGALADGTTYSQSVPVSRNGDLPIYARLSGTRASTNSGLLLGWINLTNLQADAPVNALTWIKKPSMSSALYTNGFTNVLGIQGSRWTSPSPKTPAISLTNGQLVISNANLYLAFTNFYVNNNNTLTNLGDNPSNSVTGSINPKTGRLIVALVTGKGSAITNYGAILQSTTNAGGYFLTSSNAGAMYLQP